MDILFLLIPLSVVLALLIGWCFWQAVDTGQFDDLDTPALRILADDDAVPAPRGFSPAAQPFDADQRAPANPPDHSHFAKES
jgi:cbb3-type cytochrome oxidase maturation protein